MGFLDTLKANFNFVKDPSQWEELIRGAMENKKTQNNKVEGFFRGPTGTMYKVPETERFFDEESERVIREMEERKRQEMGVSDVGGGTAYAQEPVQGPIQSETEPPATIESTEDPKMTWSREEAKKEILPEVIDYAENKLFKETDKWNLPRSLSASQWGIESGRDTTDSQPNGFGLLRDGVLVNYGSFENNVRAYAQTVASIASTNMGQPIDVSDDAAVKEFLGSHDAETLLYHLQLQSNGEAGIQRYEASLPTPQDYIEMNHNMPEWRYYQ
jgi:hypothetical protein